MTQEEVAMLWRSESSRGRGASKLVNAFTDACRRALHHAREEARRLGNAHVGTEHLVLAVVAERDREPARILTALGVRLSVVRSELEATLQVLAERERVGRPPGPDLPYTDRAKTVLERAMREAADLGDPAVDSVHLLLGVLADSRSVATQLLRRLGATLEDARAAHRIGAGGGARLQLRLDDTSETLIYQQIVEQIKEAVAIGRIRPGDRLPTVRQLADELDIAPGTVARAYGELEAAGVVVTDRARGTFVALAGRRPDGTEPPAVSVRELLRPVVVAAFHLGATAGEVRAALEQAMKDIFPDAA
jgi:DNA-binding transcriptional regulator YhcF (GntR family)